MMWYPFLIFLIDLMNLFCMENNLFLLGAHRDRRLDGRRAPAALRVLEDLRIQHVQVR